MIHEDHYGYELRVERLQDYSPLISRSAALIQARFEAHGLGQLRPSPPSVPALGAPQVPAPNDSTDSDAPNQPQA